MAFTSHFFMRSGLFYGLLTGATGICAALIIARGLQERTTPAAISSGARPQPPVWQQAARKQPPAFAVLKGLTPAADAADAEFLSEFRFAGTFFLYSPDTDNPSLRRGVLSYLPENRQEIVSEGSVINQVRVKHLYENRIVLEKDGREGTLFLGGRSSAPEAVPEKGTEAAAEVPQTLRTRFGEQTSEGVWTMEKSALMEYYDELLEEPERLLQVFDSMRPLYTEEGTIEGYQLQSVGEREFFEAVGFKEGDVVRKVNALAMTNRGRAEFFIRQVVQDRLSAIVIDIEREGDSKRLVYQLR